MIMRWKPPAGSLRRSILLRSKRLSHQTSTLWLLPSRYIPDATFIVSNTDIYSRAHTL